MVTVLSPVPRKLFSFSHGTKVSRVSSCKTFLNIRRNLPRYLNCIRKHRQLEWTLLIRGASPRGPQKDGVDALNNGRIFAVDKLDILFDPVHLGVILRNTDKALAQFDGNRESTKLRKSDRMPARTAERRRRSHVFSAREIAPRCASQSSRRHRVPRHFVNADAFVEPIKQSVLLCIVLRHPVLRRPEETSVSFCVACAWKFCLCKCFRLPNSTGNSFSYPSNTHSSPNCRVVL